MAYTGPYGWSPTGVASGISRDPNNPNQYFFQDQSGRFVGNPMAYSDIMQYVDPNSGRLMGNWSNLGGVQNYFAPPAAPSVSQSNPYMPPSVPQTTVTSAPQGVNSNPYMPSGTPAAVPTTAAAPAAPQPGTSAAQGFSANPYMPPQATPAPLGGEAPLTNAAYQGLGFGIGPFNTQFYGNLANSITQQLTRNLNENVLPQIGAGAQLAGQYGGSRQGIAEGIAARGLNDSIANAMAPIYAQGWENYLNRGVQTGQSALQGLLGLGSLDIGRMNAVTNAANVLSGSAGAPTYTSPIGSALGGADLLTQLFKNWGGG